MNYVMGDIHGEYDKFIELIEKIQLKDTDTLYILGDIVDRGPHPIKTLQKLMEMSNVICLVGNHELMALDGLRFLNSGKNLKDTDSIDAEMLGNLIDWQRNGCETTVNEFKQLDSVMKAKIIEYILSFSMYEELIVNDKKFFLVHAGLGDYSPKKQIENYSIKNLVWDSADYSIRYFDDKYVVTGHTPTQYIKNNPNPGYIYKENMHIAIDCGCGIPGGKLAVICLETGEEYYSSEC